MQNRHRIIILYIIIIDLFINLSLSITDLELLKLKEHRKCDSNDFKYGQWLKGAKECGFVYKNNDLKQKWEDWCFQPRYCNPKPFSTNDFCNNLNGKSMLFVGDSLMFQFYETLIDLIDTNIRHPDQWVPYNKINNVLICNSSSTIHFIRNDHLTIKNNNQPRNTENSLRQSHMAKFANNNWIDYMKEFDVIIISKGHHMVPLQGHPELFKRETLETIEYLQNNLNETQRLYFLTTSPGHPYCSSLDNVNDTVVTIDNITSLYISDEKSKYNDEYGWSDFDKSDEYIISLLTKLNATVINITPMTKLRPDGHMFEQDDCLHYHRPGPIDSWVLAFYNLLF